MFYFYQNVTKNRVCVTNFEGCYFIHMIAMWALFYFYFVLKRLSFSKLFITCLFLFFTYFRFCFNRSNFICLKFFTYIILCDFFKATYLVIWWNSFLLFFNFEKLKWVRFVYFLFWKKLLWWFILLKTIYLWGFI